MPRTISEIQADITATYATQATLPKGTPFRKKLEREEYDRIAPKLLELRAEMWQIEQAARKAAQAARRAEERATPEYRERQRILRELRRMGFVREYASGSSAYYRVDLPLDSITVRVSDHDVPLTPERQWNRENGGRSWAESSLSLVVGVDDADGWLEELQELKRATL